MVRLRRHTPVTVAVPALESLHAVVVDAGEDGALLALTRAAETPTRFFNRQPAELEAVTRLGVVRWSGTLAAVAGAGGRRVREDVLRFHARAGAEDVLQRRENVRAEAILSATVRPDAPLPLEHVARTLNVSGSGVLLSGARELRPEERLSVALSLPDEVIEAGGRVVRASADGLRGVALDRIRPRDRERLIRYVFARQRAGLRLTRDG